jgi:hypothetical protein
MISPSLSGIRPRLCAFFLSRFDIVKVGQSPGPSLVVAAEASGATFFIAKVILELVVLVATLATIAKPFFFTILEFLRG